MKKNYVFIILLGFIVFLGITINHYLSNDYKIDFVEKNNIKATNSLNNDYDEVLLPVAYYEYDVKKTYWGYINKQGEVAITISYEEAYDFDENNLAIVKSKNNYGLINTKNEKVLDFKYDVIKYMGEGIYYYAQNEVGKLAAFATPNKINDIVDVYYDEVGMYKEGLAAVVKDKKIGYIDTNGEEKISLKFDYDKDFNFNFYNGFAFIKKDQKFGIINSNGTIISEPKYDKVINDYILKFDFTEVYYEDYDLIPVKIDGKWGYIRRNGEKVIEPIFLEAYPFTDNNLARVKLTNGYYNFIDSQGKKLNETNYVEAFDFYNGYAMTSLKVNEKEGMINTTGTTVIPNKYDYVGTYQQNRVLTINNGVSKYHLIDIFDSVEFTIRINYYLGDDMTACGVVFATDDKINYVILNLSGERIHQKVTVNDYKQINYKN